MTKTFPVIDPVATGANIVRLRKMRGLSVQDLQNWFGFDAPQAIYKWQKGKSLPTIDNLYALGALLDVPMEEILVPCKPKLNIVTMGQQAEACCPPVFYATKGFVMDSIHRTERIVIEPLVQFLLNHDLKRYACSMLKLSAIHSLFLCWSAKQGAFSSCPQNCSLI